MQTVALHTLQAWNQSPLSLCSLSMALFVYGASFSGISLIRKFCLQLSTLMTNLQLFCCVKHFGKYKPLYVTYITLKSQLGLNHSHANGPQTFLIKRGVCVPRCMDKCIILFLCLSSCIHTYFKSNIISTLEAVCFQG